MKRSFMAYADAASDELDVVVAVRSIETGEEIAAPYDVAAGIGERGELVAGVSIEAMAFDGECGGASRRIGRSGAANPYGAEAPLCRLMRRRCPGRRALADPPQQSVSFPAAAPAASIFGNCKLIGG